jgi:hypothetical protein
MRLRPTRTGTTPGHRGRFDGFDVLGQAPTWDPVTEGVVLGRLGPGPPVRFFTTQEEATCRPLLDRLLGQEEEPRIPLFEPIDSRLAEAEGDGWRHEDMPEDGEAWRRSLAALEDRTHERLGKPFHELDRPEQDRLVESIRTSDEVGGLPGRWVWNLWMRYALAAFYAHPWAWNEIGFGGPAYPRGYKNLGLDGREDWETQERDARDPIPWSERLERTRRGQ